MKNMFKKELGSPNVLRNNAIDQVIDKVLNNESGKGKTEKGTGRQICLIFHYLNKVGFAPKKSGTPLNDAEFLHFITGLSVDNLRKKITNPFAIQDDDKNGKKTKSLLEDLRKVKFQFERILFSQGIELIEKDIRILENTLKSYKEE
jgi:hypothetical protein